MELWEIILIALIIEIVAPMILLFFWAFKLRGEKKLSSEEKIIRTRPPKVLLVFFLGFALFILLGGIIGIIYCCITDSENTTALQVIVFSLSAAVFSCIGFFGYAWVRFNYVVADDEGIHVYRLFRKTNFIRYDEISCYQDTISMGIMGGLVGYDKYENKIFSVEAIHIGSSAVALRLREHGVSEKLQSQLSL